MVLLCRTFLGGHFTRESEGRIYRRLRDPEIIRDVWRGDADVGFIGSDKIIEAGSLRDRERGSVMIEWIGRVAGCDFVLAAQPDKISDIEDRMENGGRRLNIVTSYPTWLESLGVFDKCVTMTRVVSGSAEAYADDVDLIADLRVTGNTLRDNGLQEFRVLDSVKLGLIYRDREMCTDTTKPRI